MLLRLCRLQAWNPFVPCVVLSLPVSACLCLRKIAVCPHGPAGMNARRLQPTTWRWSLDTGCGQRGKSTNSTASKFFLSLAAPLRCDLCTRNAPARELPSSDNNGRAQMILSARETGNAKVSRRLARLQGWSSSRLQTARAPFRLHNTYEFTK